MSDKIQAQHRGRKAMLYVRQSSQHQVLHNQESQRLQYAMRDRLLQLGWDEVEVIDEDLGRSASGSAQRSGFERMMAAFEERKLATVLIVDDLLATGGTVLGTIDLVKQLKGEIVGLSFLVELEFLKGRERLDDYPINSVIAY